MFALIRGAGDLASGIAIRLYRAGFDVAMADLWQPTSIRRTVCFSEAIRLGETQVEDVSAGHANGIEEIVEILEERKIAVFADPNMEILSVVKPDVLIDAIIAKRNLGTKIDNAPVVIGVGPGFTAGTDCHAVVETKRGHNLGRVYTRGSAAPDTGEPGNIGGYTYQRVLRAPAAGVFNPTKNIGDLVTAGEAAGNVDGQPVLCTIDGVLRGILPENILVYEGMKCGDIDPRCDASYCFTVSDKALAVAGGALEAALMLSKG